MANVTALKPATPKQLPAPNSDFYQIEETLNSDELAILKKVRLFMETRVAPVINQYWVDDAFPFDSGGAARRIIIYRIEFSDAI